MRRLCLGFALLALTAAAPAAIERNLTDEAISEAIATARRTRPENRSAFHRSYVFRTGSVPIASVSVVTEFRRIVLAAEEQLDFGNHMWGLRQARETLAPYRGTFTIVADVVFHPQNAYVTVPQYAIRIIPQEGPAIASSGVKTTARYGLQSVSTPSNPPYFPFPPPTLPIGPGAEPMLGAWVEATFSASAIDPKALVLVAVSEGGTDLARVSVDLSTLR